MPESHLLNYIPIEVYWQVYPNMVCRAPGRIETHARHRPRPKGPFGESFLAVGLAWQIPFDLCKCRH